MDVLYSLLAAFEGAPLVGLCIFAAAIIARAAIKHDLDKWDIVVALIAIGAAVTFARAPNGGHRTITLIQSSVALVLTLAMVLPWPASARNWAAVADGAPLHRIVNRHAGQVLVKQQDSTIDFAEWSVENRRLRILFLLSAAFIYVVAVEGWNIILFFFAAIIYAIATASFGWSQFVRLNHMPRYARPSAPAADPTPQQPQGQSRRRRDLA
ncbi:MAG: hypothetical protein B7W99_00900 [Rhodospirillales bacterium 20-58-10]|nr:MAG: hypothetical protein B7W99_00900 [Rhodospirillales bacterium 20-58-10]